MNVANLVGMANQIGEFFEAMPDRDEALAGLSQHLRKFWAPRMRIALTDHAMRHGQSGLAPIVLEALRNHPIMTPPDMSRPQAPVSEAEHHAMDGGSES